MLRKLFLMISFAAIVFAFFACGSDDSDDSPTDSTTDVSDHKLRVRNDMPSNYNMIWNVTIGSLVFEGVAAGDTTEYQDIDAGTHTFNISVTVDTFTAPVTSGSITIQGEGEHFWTMVLEADGVEVVED